MFEAHKYYYKIMHDRGKDIFPAHLVHFSIYLDP